MIPWWFGPDPYRMGDSLQKWLIAWAAALPNWQARMDTLLSALIDWNREAIKTLASPPAPGETHSDPKASILQRSKALSSTATRLHGILSAFLLESVTSAPDLPEADRNRLAFAVRQINAASNPANSFWLNPGAVRRFLDTGGETLKQGLSQQAASLSEGDGLPRLVDNMAFTLGKNLAQTPGRVVFRNELVELIQYEPETETVFPVPVLFVQPWINKYYIFDLTAQNSFVRYLLREGFTVFITSWKNPTAEMRKVTFDDYLFKGILAPTSAAGEITGAKQIHAAGYCIGGTALCALAAYLNHPEQDEIEVPFVDISLFSTLIDFSKPGDLGNFSTPESLSILESVMKTTGYLDSRLLSLTFRLLNPDALLWRPFVNNCLFGQPPPKSDMLFWNSDGTRLPADMAAFYLRNCYLENRLSQKRSFPVADKWLDITDIHQPAYVVGAEKDHISPWKSTFAAVNLLGGPIRYVLSTEGHITGIVNPPSKRSKKKYWVNDGEKRIDPETWISQNDAHTGSWWPDWVQWLTKRSGERTAPPALGSSAYPVLGKAPGTYVLE